jgi:hypothetical protein
MLFRKKDMCIGTYIGTRTCKYAKVFFCAINILLLQNGSRLWRWNFPTHRRLYHPVQQIAIWRGAHCTIRSDRIAGMSYSVEEGFWVDSDLTKYISD